MSNDELLTVREVMARTKLSRSTVMSLIAAGELPSLTIRRARRVRSTSLSAWIDERASQSVSGDAGQEEPR
jgi:excisionase family DNA binding protein